MPVLINFKICDNAEECGGIAACPTGALYWDAEKKQVSTDDTKCIKCKKCENACPVGAIHVADNEEEYAAIKKEIEADPRKREDLLVDRYGAQPIDAAFQLPQEQLNLADFQSGTTAVEFYDEDALMCLIKSIPVKELFDGIVDTYRKVEVKDKSILEKMNITKLPTLLLVKEGKLLGKVEGYYGIDKKAELIDKINGIIG